MLIATFQVKCLNSFALLEGSVGRFQVLIHLGHGKPTGAGIEPHVQDVGFLAKLGASAVSAGSVVRKQRLDCRGMPGLDSFALKHVHDSAVECGIENGLVTALAKKHRDGHAPDALAADAPVGPGGDHVADAFFAPDRVPDHLVDFFDGKLAIGCFRAVGAMHRSLQADEPLLGSPEDDRMVAAPAVWVGVFQIGGSQ
jgi:hypothetical protein